MERVANYADGYFGNEEIRDLYIEKLRQHGRIRPSGYSNPRPVPDRRRGSEKAMEELAPYYHHVYTSYGAWMNEDNAIGLDNPATQPMGVGAFKRSGIVQILTPEQAVSYFRRCRSGCRWVTSRDHASPGVAG